MDLASIRKKSRNLQPVPLPPETDRPGSAADRQPRKVSRRRVAGQGLLSPLEIILAGRQAAGCSADTGGIASQPLPAVAGPEEVLCFRISEKIFGITIMQIKEILKPRPVTEVPRAPAYLTGVISLRGVIIPVLDLHERLGLGHLPSSGKERLVVIKTVPEGDLAGLLVDQVLQVARLSGAIEPAPPLPAGIDPEFVAGIGRADERIIILLNPERLAALPAGQGAAGTPGAARHPAPAPLIP